MKYWQIRKDLRQDFRALETSGPVWGSAAYFDKDYVSPNWGPFDPSRLDFHFSKRQKKLPAADFYQSGFPPSCSKRVYALFAQLIGPYVETFPLKVDGESFVTFRPKRFFDLIDLEKSSYDTFSDGEPYNFRQIVLLCPPPIALPIFGISSPSTARLDIIVGDEFEEIYDRHKLTGLWLRQAYPPADSEL